MLSSHARCRFAAGLASEVSFGDELPYPGEMQKVHPLETLEYLRQRKGK